MVDAVASPSPDVVDRQIARLHHRGPDASGRFTAGRGIVAQNRLAVIDLQTGDPPLTNETGTVGAVLNGEIYNFKLLRDELLSGGHRFRSAGDTEVIAHLAEAHSPLEIMQRLDGMFALAVWDAQRERLILARDRLGKKPLYYFWNGRRLVFGSEIKAVLADPAVPRELNPRAIPAYLTFGYVPTPETFFRGVVSLPPAHVLTYSPGAEPVIECYWSLPVAGVDGVTSLDVGLEEASDMVRAALTRAVERRLVADVPLGAFLSGGVDSSAIVGIMASASERPVKTFTIGFEDEALFDERPYARHVARLFGTEHHEHVVHPDAVDLLETLLWHHDQPFGDSSALPTYLVAQMTRGDVTVALSGDGGDELFGGYERFAAALALERYRRTPRAARTAIARVIGRLPPNAFQRRAESLQRFVAVDKMPLLDGFRTWLSFFDEDDRRQALLEPDLWALEDYAARWDQSAGANQLDRLLALNLHTYLPDDLLVKADRMSMAHALEVRSPFLDQDLVELAFRLPAHFKLRGTSRKRVLTSAVRDLLPAEILRRRKRGFAVPLDRWFRHELRNYLAEMVGTDKARIRSYLTGDSIDRLIAQHATGRRNHGQKLWLLLMLELFLRREEW